MNDAIRVVGIDPGLVHTGVVSMVFIPGAHRLLIESAVVDGADAELTANWIGGLGRGTTAQVHIFIEGYRPRSNFGTDTRMLKAVTDLKAVMPKAKVLNNTGVKKIVKRGLMELMKVWTFATPTHHQDLRSAARIALLGMFKDPELNKVIADFVEDMEFNTANRWSVQDV